MKYLVTVLLTVLALSTQAQNFGVKEKDSCYFRWITLQKKVDGRDTTVREKMTKNQIRYAEWECGKELGVVDCNNDLSMDQETEIVYKENHDLSNVAGGNKPFSGTCESCHMNGRLQRRVTFVNGQENGTDTTFYESGCPEVVRQMIQGKPHGQWTYMYDSTEFLAWEMNYYMGEKEGRQMYFAKPYRGNKNRWMQDTLKVENYKAGILNGAKKTYYKRAKDGSGGGLKREVNYKNGVFEGLFRIYNLDRVIIEELNYKAGKKDQECNYYYNDGVLLKTEHWDEGIKNGEFKTFYYQGHIQTSGNYKKGLKEGWFEEYYPDQTTKSRALFKKGVLIEEHRYDEHGRETYSFGTPTGNNSEDDEMPTTDKKKKKKKKEKKDKGTEEKEQ